MRTSTSWYKNLVVPIATSKLADFQCCGFIAALFQRCGLFKSRTVACSAYLILYMILRRVLHFSVNSLMCYINAAEVAVSLSTDNVKLLIHLLTYAKTSRCWQSLSVSSVGPSTRPQPWPGTGRRCYWSPSVASLPMLWHEISLTFQRSSSASRPSPSLSLHSAQYVTQTHTFTLTKAFKL